MENNLAIKISNVSKTFRLTNEPITTLKTLILKIFKKKKYRYIKALDDISIEIYKGEKIGIIGRNGSGKSTLLKIILGAIPHDKGGSIELHGKIIRLSLGIGFDLSLTARENIYINGSILGLTMKQIGERFGDIVDFAELEDFVDTKVKYFSKGMKSRLAFAIAIQAEADIMMLDEFFGGVGDLIFKKKSEEVFNESILTGRTILMVSHQLGDIVKHCDKVLYLKEGKCAYWGDPKTAVAQYKKDNETKLSKENKDITN